MLDHLPRQALRAPQNPHAFPTGGRETRGPQCRRPEGAGSDQRSLTPSTTRVRARRADSPSLEDHPRLANARRRRKRALAARVCPAPPRKLPAALGGSEARPSLWFSAPPPRLRRRGGVRAEEGRGWGPRDKSLGGTRSPDRRGRCLGGGATVGGGQGA